MIQNVSYIMYDKHKVNRQTHSIKTWGKNEYVRVKKYLWLFESQLFNRSYIFY